MRNIENLIDIVKIVIELLLITMWVKATISDLKTKTVRLSDCVIISLLSLFISVMNGNKLLNVIPFILFCMIIFAKDNSKYIGTADFLIPIHFICIYINNKTSYTDILFILSTMCYSLGIYIVLHKHLTGIRWKRGMVTAGLPPYCLTIIIIFIIKSINMLML